MKSSYKICEVMRIPIRLHITLVVFLPLLIPYVAFEGKLNLLLALVAVAGFFASIALHELGHAAVAMRYGCGVRQILLMPIGGVAQLTHMPESPRAEIWIAIAGPAVSLALSIVCFVLAIPLSGLALTGLTQVFMVWSAINLVLVLFNLLPSFPMDGGRIFRALMTPRIGRLRATYIASRVGRFMAIAFGIFGLLRGHFILVAIAVFIHHAASAEYRMVQVQEARRADTPPHPGMWFGSRPPPAQPTISDEVVVSPPPYARGPPLDSRPSRPRRGLFAELFENFGDRR